MLGIPARMTISCGGSLLYIFNSGILSNFDLKIFWGVKNIARFVGGFTSENKGKFRGENR